MKIAIDAGHGLHTSGKRCLKSIDKNETREWFLNDRIADKLCNMLKSYDVEVIRVDDTTGATDVSLSKRCTVANNAGANIYISIHHNVGVNGGNGGGTQVYYYSSNKQRAVEAELLYKHIVNTTGLIGNRSEKVIKNAFYVLKNTKMAAFLIENGFMDSTTDTPIILSDTHAEKTAKGILNFLVNEYGIKKSVGDTFKIGDRVKVINNKTYDGKTFKVWYSTYYVMGVNDDRIVIGQNGVVTAAIHSRNIKKV